MATCLRSPEYTESGGYAPQSYKGSGLLRPSGGLPPPSGEFCPAQPWLGPGSSLPK